MNKRNGSNGRMAWIEGMKGRQEWQDGRNGMMEAMKRMARIEGRKD
jgi:hypothetical protein